MVDKLRLDIELNINQSRLNAQTREVIRKARLLDREFNKIGGRELGGVTKAFKSAETSIAGVSRQAGRATGALSDMSKQAGLTARRFIIYNVIAGFFFRLTTAIKDGVGAFVEFDAALNRAEQILNPLTSDMGRLRKAVFDLGNEFGVTVSQVQAAQEVFIRQGLALKEANELTRQSLALSTATAIDAAAATEALTTVMRQFGEEAGKASEIVDVFSAVSINFAVTTTDLAEGINRAGSAAATVGVNFQELTGFIAAAQEATRRGGRVIGTGLRTIFTRIFRAPAIEALEELGIRTRETTGEFRSASALLRELAGRFTDLSNTQKIAVASTISGQRQIATLLALLRNWNRAIDATSTALDSQGTAMELVRKRQETVEVQLRRVINQFVEFGATIGEIFSGDVLDFIKLFGNAIGTVGGAIGALSGAGGGTFDLITGALAKGVILLGLQALGVGKLTTATGARVKSLIGITAAEKRIVLSQKQGLINVKTSIKDGKLVLKTTQARNKTLEGQLRNSRFQSQATALQTEEQNAQIKLIFIATQLEREKLSLKQDELNLQRQITTEQLLGNKQAAILLNQKTKEAQLRKSLDRLRVSPEAKGNVEQQRIKIGEKLFQLEQKRETFGKKGASERLKIANAIFDAEIKITSLKKQRGKAEGLEDAEKRRLKVSQLIVRINKQQGIVDTANSALKKQGLLDAVNLELEILRIKGQAISLTDKEAKRKAQTRKISGEIGRLTVQSNRETANIEKERLKINTEIAAVTDRTAASQVRMNGLLTTSNRLQTRGVERAAKIAQVTKQIATNQQKLNIQIENQNKSLTRGAGGFAAAFGISLLIGGITEAMREFGDESSKGMKAATEATQGFGSALTTLAIAGGPLGILLATVQVVTTISKVFKQLKFDAVATLKAVQDEATKANNITRTFSTSLSNLSQIVKKAELGKSLDIADFEKIDDVFIDLSKATGIATNELLRFKSAIQEAAQAGDAQGLKETLDSLERFASQKNIEKGNILNSDTISEAIRGYDEAGAALDTFQDRLRGLQTGGASTLGISSNADQRTKNAFGNDSFAGSRANLEAIRETWGGLTSEVEKSALEHKAAFETLEIGGRNALKQFRLLVDPSKSFAENLSVLGEETNDLFRITGQLNGAWDIYIRKLGLVRKASLDALVLSQNEAELSATARFQDAFAEGNGDIRQTLSLMRELGIAAGQAAEVGFEFKEGFADTEQFQRFIEILAESAGASTDTVTKLLANTKNLRSGIILVKDANDDWAITNTETGVTLQVLDKHGQALAATLTGQLIPAGFNVVKSQEDVAKAFASASLIVDAFEQRLQGATRRIERQTAGLQRLSTAVKGTESNMSLLKDVFAEEIFRAPIAGINTLIDSVETGSLSITKLSSLMERFEDINNEAAISISNDMRRALDEGVDGFDLYNARIDASLRGIDSAKRINQEYAETLKAIKEVSGGELGFATDELETLTRQRGQMELLAQALQGLVAFRDKLDQSGKGTPILKKDRESAEKFLNTIKTIIPGVDVDNIKKFLTFSGSQKTQIVQQLRSLFDSIKIQSNSISDPILSEIIANFGTAIQEAVQAASTAGAKSTTRTLSNALLKDVKRFTDASKSLFTSFVQAAGEFANANAAQLGTAIQLTEKRLAELAQATSRGSFLPDFSGDDIEILQRQFARIRVVTKKQRALLEADLKPINQRINELVRLTTNFNEGNTFNRGQEENTKAVNELKEARQKQAAAESEIAGIRVTERNVTGAFLRQLGIQLDLFSNKQNEVFKSQNALIEAEAALAQKKTEFAAEEATTFEAKIALIEAEANAIEQLTREASSLGDLDINAISKRLVELTGRLTSDARKKLNSVQITEIERQIAVEQNRLSIVQQIDNVRLSSLQKEREIINEQAGAIRSLGIEFIKANDTQQKAIIESARGVETFFGKLTPESLDSPAFQRQASSFLRETNDEMRNAVIAQLERLKNVGGEVSSGVSAESVLKGLAESVVGALFKSPLEANASKQTELQTRILGILDDTKKISEIQSNLLVTAMNAARRSFEGLAARGSQGLADQDDETIKQAREVQETLSLGQEKIININRLRAKAEDQYAAAAENAAIQNKNLVNATRAVNTATQNTGESAEDYQKRLVGLRDAFIKAEDDFISAQTSFADALGGIGEALSKVAVAQADYSIGLELARRQNIAITGSFATFRSEITFLGDAFRSQIDALTIVGASEQQIANLRVKLAQETLSIIERQLSGFRDRALSLFTGDLQPGDVQRQAGAAATVAGITATSSGDALVAELAKLPEAFRRDALEGLGTAPPGTTFGGLSGEEIINQIATAFGGETAGGDTIESLQQEAARQRLIIAENSTSALFNSREGLIAAQEQLSSAKEALLEAKAQKELAELQLNATQTGFENNQRAVDVLADGINSTATNTGTLAVLNEQMSGTLDQINANMNRLALRNFVAAGDSDSLNQLGISAAGGTLSGGEVAGLLRAASREKAAMPHGSNLGVFNTSETVLTRNQMNRLRRGTATPNAIDGNGTVISGEVVVLLGQINERLALLSSQGINQQFNIDIDNNRTVSIQGLAGLQTALQDIVLDATGELYTREEAEALESVVMTVIERLQETGQISAIGT